ncbi:unnamed protein product [marine sediment metagenome]|uniref:Uncharacterized protein n=1 Tax=marine sediment metagenome TaxID=412755 RepID=X0YU67_9ZZZZ
MKELENISKLKDELFEHPVFKADWKLYGVYSDNERLLAVHATEEGANENKDKWAKQHGNTFYVDFVTVHK